MTVHTAPRLTEAEAVTLARDLYGMAVSASPLPSERDQNFLLQDSHGKRFVLKLANGEEDQQVLDFQNRAWDWLAGKGCIAPGLIPARDGARIGRSSGHLVRLFSWIDGQPLADIRSRTPELLASLGAALAGIDAALVGFSHPAMNRDLHWDIRHADLAR